MSAVTKRIPREVLAEQWFRFMHRLIGDMQNAFRNAQSSGQTTQKEMAERLGKKPSFISRCLSGQQNMTIRTIHDLARAMECRLEVSFRPLADLTPTNRHQHLAAGARYTWSKTLSTHEPGLTLDNPPSATATIGTAFHQNA